MKSIEETCKWELLRINWLLLRRRLLQDCSPRTSWTLSKETPWRLWLILELWEDQSTFPLVLHMYHSCTTKSNMTCSLIMIIKINLMTFSKIQWVKSHWFINNPSSRNLTEDKKRRRKKWRERDRKKRQRNRENKGEQILGSRKDLTNLRRKSRRKSLLNALKMNSLPNTKYMISEIHRQEMMVSLLLVVLLVKWSWLGLASLTSSLHLQQIRTLCSLLTCLKSI